LLPLELLQEGRELPRELGTKPLLVFAPMGFQDRLQPGGVLLEEGHRREVEHFRAERFAAAAKSGADAIFVLVRI
jgi:hypothetical protein